jgi:hypothetical protein
VELLLIRHDGDGGARQQLLEGGVFHVGRGTSCEVHLPDARVALTHARIAVGATGAAIEAVEQRFVHNDREVSSAKLAPGDYVEVGPYLLKVEEPAPGVPLALSVRISKRMATQERTALFRVLLRAPRLSKRRLSYAAFFGTLVLALAAPIASDLIDAQRLPLPDRARSGAADLVQALGTGFVQAWNPGELLRAHVNFGHECRACHKSPFQRVPDTACGSCHAGVREHVAVSKLSGASAYALGETRCAECHRDHKGRVAAAHSEQLCSQCHARMEQAASRTELLKVSDFAHDHPHFRLSIVDAADGGKVRRVRQRDPGVHLAERSNLKFNHTLHLDARGVRAPRGGRTVLACGDCHEAGEGGARMQPVSMERHCSSCHALTFEPGAARREVPHAPLEEVERTLREFYARLVIGDVPPEAKHLADLARLRPGVAPTPEERREAMRVADEKASRALRELMQTRAVCSTCHYVERTAARPGWRIAPVALTSAWMPAANFRHDRHASQTCVTCHDVRASRKAEDIAMPDIVRCRECHAGSRATPGKVASDCATCHRFHGGQNPWH